nr:MAG TPA: hypothetical protein [Caudoviricetes sp.]
MTAFQRMEGGILKGISPSWVTIYRYRRYGGSE